MPAFRASRRDQLFLQDQSALRTVPNSGGASTLAIGNYARYSDASLAMQVPTLVRSDRTGTLSPTAGSKSIESANWSVKGSLAAGATQGAIPPYGPILKAAFGATATAVTGSTAITGATNATPIVVTATGHGKAVGDAVYVSGVLGNTAANGAWIVSAADANTLTLAGSAGNGAYSSGGTASFAARKYTLADTALSFVAAIFNSESTLKQFLAYGLFPQTLKMEFGGLRLGMFEAQGNGMCVLDNDTFADQSVTGQAGLTAFPAQPTGTLPTDSGAITGFHGALIVDGASLPCIASATLEMQTGRTLGDPPCLNEDYYDRIISDVRSVTSALQIIDSDVAAALTLYARAKSKALFDVHLRMGKTAPGIYLAQLKNCQAEHSGADSGSPETKRNYRITAHGTGNNDELTLWVF